MHHNSAAAVKIRRELEAVNCKWCNSCKRTRHVEHFHKCAGRRDGLQVRCIECMQAFGSEYQRKNRARLTEAHRRWVNNNRERFSATAKRYRSLPSSRKKHAERMAAARQTVSGTLKNRITSRIYAILRGGKGGAKTEALVGYTMAELRIHLERQFARGMSWENMGEWHIDHIVPLSSFTISGPHDPELRRAWSLPNLRPLWARENLQKQDMRVSLL